MDLITWIILGLTTIILVVYVVFRFSNKKEDSSKNITAKKGGRGKHFYPTGDSSSISKEVEIDGISKAESMKRKAF